MTTTLQRMIGLLLLVALPATLLSLAALNLIDGLSFRDEARLQTVMLARLENRAKAVATGDQPLDLDRIYLGGETGSLAGAALRQRVVDAIAGAGGSLIETRTADLPQALAADAGWVAVTTSFEVGHAGLATLLRDLETGLPLLLVDGLAVRRDAGSGDSASAAPADPQLRVDLTVRGAHRVDTP